MATQRRLSEILARSRRQREINTEKFTDEIKGWIGEETGRKCASRPSRMLLGATGLCAVFFDTGNLNATERTALEQKVMLHFHARSEESFVKEVEIRPPNIIIFRMIDQ